jgi:hypothetical protein
LFALARCGDPQKRAHGIRHPTILANHASHVIAYDTQFDANVTATTFEDLNVFRFTDKRLSYVLDKLFHNYSSAD